MALENTSFDAFLRTREAISSEYINGDPSSLLVISAGRGPGDFLPAKRRPHSRRARSQRGERTRDKAFWQRQHRTLRNMAINIGRRAGLFDRDTACRRSHGKKRQAGRYEASGHRGIPSRERRVEAHSPPCRRDQGSMTPQRHHSLEQLWRYLCGPMKKHRNIRHSGPRMGAFCRRRAVERLERRYCKDSNPWAVQGRHSFHHAP